MSKKNRSNVKALATAGAFVVGGVDIDRCSVYGRGMELSSRSRDLKPGYNVDRIDIAAMVTEAVACGYGGMPFAMVVEYAGQRWVRGEEQGAFDTMMSHGIDLTSTYRIAAAGQAHAYVPKHVDTPASVR